MARITANMPGDSNVGVETPNRYDARLLSRAVVLESPKKKKKKKYTRNTKAFQELAQGVSDATFRSSNALSTTAKNFAKRSKKSSRKKRDGLLRDLLRNTSKSFGNGASELGRAPDALARRIRTGQIRRAVRSFVR